MRMSAEEKFNLSAVVFIEDDWKTSRQLDLLESIAWSIIEILESGKTQRTVVNAVEAPRSVISKLLNRFQEAKHVRRWPEQGHPCATATNNDRYILQTGRRDRTTNAKQVQIQFLLTRG
ncbi:hypothetical protein TNCV_3977121 [Trichonephila clavipes]|nr:hypothetical protein TNCV_3977121 [Trichonephila clavipes]